jgi:hypothetical protein
VGTVTVVVACSVVVVPGTVVGITGAALEPAKVVVVAAAFVLGVVGSVWSEAVVGELGASLGGLAVVVGVVVVASRVVVVAGLVVVVARRVVVVLRRVVVVLRRVVVVARRVVVVAGLVVVVAGLVVVVAGRLAIVVGAGAAVAVVAAGGVVLVLVEAGKEGSAFSAVIVEGAAAGGREMTETVLFEALFVVAVSTGAARVVAGGGTAVVLGGALEAGAEEGVAFGECSGPVVAGGVGTVVTGGVTGGVAVVTTNDVVAGLLAISTVLRPVILVVGREAGWRCAPPVLARVGRGGIVGRVVVVRAGLRGWRAGSSAFAIRYGRLVGSRATVVVATVEGNVTPTVVVGAEKVAGWAATRRWCEV